MFKEKFPTLWANTFPDGSPLPVICKAELQAIALVDSLWGCRGGDKSACAVVASAAASASALALGQQMQLMNAPALHGLQFSMAPTLRGASRSPLALMGPACQQPGGSPNSSPQDRDQSLKDLRDSPRDDGGIKADKATGVVKHEAAEPKDEKAESLVSEEDELQKLQSLAYGEQSSDVGEVSGKRIAEAMKTRREVRAKGASLLKRPSAPKTKAKPVRPSTTPSKGADYRAPFFSVARSRSHIECRPGSKKASGLTGCIIHWGKGAVHKDEASAVRAAKRWAKLHA